MPGTYRAINYALRPAKAIERRMLCAAFQRLYPFQRTENYRYVGFGSIYFSDFQIIHRELGIRKMISIERDVSARACFRFNRPYKCISLKFGESGEVLPTLSSQPRTIFWLDFEDRLNVDVLADVATVSLRARSGSVIVISVNAQAEAEPPGDERRRYEEETGKSFDLAEHRLRTAETLVGEKLPAGTSGADLRGQGLAKVFRNIIDNQIAEHLSIRNMTLAAEDHVCYQQLFHFRYKDGAQMLTVGGIFYSEADQPKFAACDFDTLPFLRNGVEHYDIKVPYLTPKEIRHLNSQLPPTPLGRLKTPGVPDGHIQRYAEIYRYFPTFSEIFFA